MTEGLRAVQTSLSPVVLFVIHHSLRILSRHWLVAMAVVWLLPAGPDVVLCELEGTANDLPRSPGLGQMLLLGLGLSLRGSAAKVKFDV